MNQREIKFRQYLGKGEWHYWGFLEYGGFTAPVQIDRLPSQQFTGLKDKNGKEIFESDFVEDSIGQKYEIKWIQEEGNLKAIDKDGQFRHFKDIQFMEVVGNIYEK